MPCLNPSIQKSLQVNERVIVNIYSDCKWNNTGIKLIAGQTYRFDANGTWTDLSINADANGYAYNDPRVPWYSKLGLYTLQSFKRQPNSSWFKLIGCLDNESNCFEIGKSSVIKPSANGNLFCYANDLSISYGNNSGFINLTITRLA